MVIIKKNTCFNISDKYRVSETREAVKIGDSHPRAVLIDVLGKLKQKEEYHYVVAAINLHFFLVSRCIPHLVT